MIDVLGYTEEEAQKELEDISNESSVSMERFDFADSMAQEGNAAEPEKEPEAQEEDEEAAEDES